MLPIPLLCLTLLPSTLAHTQSRLFHRIYHPLDPPVQFSPRGSILISDSSAAFQPAETYSDDLRYFADTLQSLDGALYEVALEREGDPTDWVFSSVKACHLLMHTEDHLVFHVSNDGKPFAVNYFVSPVPHNGVCPKTKKSDTIIFPPFINTTLSIRSSDFPPLPMLRTPPPLTAEGEPVKPEPEKTFLQKYWLYIVAAMFALLLTGGVEEEVPRRGGN